MKAESKPSFSKMPAYREKKHTSSAPALSMIRKPPKIPGLFLFALFILFVLILLIPQKMIMPVEGAGHQDYHPNSFWYYPWGKSIVHKGIDIFAEKGTSVFSCTGGLVIYSGYNGMGGEAIIILGPQWRLHYYAHLDQRTIHAFGLVKRGTIIGSVGNTGNAVGKPPHLHYALITLIPYVWRADNSVQGWKKMFYLNPLDHLPEN